MKVLCVLVLIPIIALSLIGNSSAQNLNYNNTNVTQDLLTLLANKNEPQNVNPLSNINNNANFDNRQQNNNSVESQNLFNYFQTILLNGISLPEGGILHLYDTYPFQINTGKLIAKLPCNENNRTSIDVLVGNMNQQKNANLSLSKIKDSTRLCFYSSLIDENNSKLTITDVFLRNNSTDDIDFPSTSSLILGVKKMTLIN